MLLTMKSENYQEYQLNGVRVTLILNTKRHVWQIWYNSNMTIEEAKYPHLEFTKAKGEAIIKFLEVLQNGKG